jgi:hypothetical protein
LINSDLEKISESEKKENRNNNSSEIIHSEDINKEKKKI